MTEIERLRDQAVRARRLAADVTDTHARTALNAYADQLERKATEIERLQ